MKGRPTLRHPVKNFSNLAAIMSAVSNEFGIAIPDICGHSRRFQFLYPRFVAWGLIKKHTDYTDAVIGDLFERQHGAVSHGLRTLNNIVESEPAFRARWEKLCALFQ